MAKWSHSKNLTPADQAKLVAHKAKKANIQFALIWAVLTGVIVYLIIK